jgi:hypothetical protein
LQCSNLSSWWWWLFCFSPPLKKFKPMWARPMIYWETPILLNICMTQHEPGSRSNWTGMLNGSTRCQLHSWTAAAYLPSFHFRPLWKPVVLLAHVSALDPSRVQTGRGGIDPNPTPNYSLNASEICRCYPCLKPWWAVRPPATQQSGA